MTWMKPLILSRKWLGAAVVAGVVAVVPFMTERAAQGQGGFAPMASAEQTPLLPPDRPFPSERVNPEVLAAAKRRVIAELLPRTDNGAVVHLIVGVAAPFVPEGGLDASAASAQRAGIAAAQGRVLSQLPRASASNIKRYWSIPFFAATVDRDALEVLSELADATSVSEDKHGEALLPHSTGIVQANQLWGAGVEGTGWAVAVLDTGVATGHAALSGRIVSEACYSTNNWLLGDTSLCPGGVEASTDPGSGKNCAGSGCDHGTHVAGIIAARGSYSGHDIHGVARGANIVAMQVFSYSSIAGRNIYHDSDVIRGLERVLELSQSGSTAGRIAAANLSLGNRSGQYSNEWSCDFWNPIWKAAIDNLRSRGIATVISSGNDSQVNSITEPACISTAVSVGATTKEGRVADYSNQHPDLIELMAPGGCNGCSATGDIFSSVIDTYDYKAGTSMAAPHVAGAWALLKQVAALRGRELSVTAALSALRGTGATVSDTRPTASGARYPEIRVYDAAVRIYTDVVAPGAPTGLTANASGSNIELRWNTPPTGGSPTGYQIEAGSAPGRADLANFATGNSGTSFQASGVGAGTYYVRVRAYNAAATSNPSNEAVLRVGGVTLPGAPRNLGGTVLGAQVQFRWDAPATNASVASAPSGYFLDAGSSSGASNLGTFDLGNVTAYLAENVARGTYYVRVRAYNAAGTSGPSNEVIVLPNQGTGTGDLSATLTWNTGSSSRPVDMDLHVLEPSGYHVYFAARTGPTARLDTDNMIGLGPENIFVSPGRAATGTYQVYVHAYSGSVWPTTATITIRTNVGTANERYTTIQRVYSWWGSSQNVATITFPGGAITERSGARSVPAAEASAVKR